MSEAPSGLRNLWQLTVLCLLRQEPLHPYEMDRRIREWHKDEVLDLKRGSLYHAIRRLHQDGLIEPLETIREGKRPERTVYRLTPAGEREVLSWLRELLREPIHEPNQFMAALSYLGHLPPDDATRQLENRCCRLEAAVTELDQVLERMVPLLGRLLLLEVEYARAMRQAELAWVRGLTEELRNGNCTWDPEAVRKMQPERKQRRDWETEKGNNDASGL